MPRRLVFTDRLSCGQEANALIELESVANWIADEKCVFSGLISAGKCYQSLTNSRDDARRLSIPTSRTVSKKPLLRCQTPTLALMDNLERVSVRIKHVRGVVSRIVFDSRPR